jgi:hypothetical protein
MKRVRITLGQRQAEALMNAALMGIEDLNDYDDPDSRGTARLADIAVDRLVAAMKKAEA